MHEIDGDDEDEGDEDIQRHEETKKAACCRNLGGYLVGLCDASRSRQCLAS